VQVDVFCSPNVIRFKYYTIFLATRYVCLYIYIYIYVCIYTFRCLQCSVSFWICHWIIFRNFSKNIRLKHYKYKFLELVLTLVFNSFSWRRFFLPMIKFQFDHFLRIGILNMYCKHMVATSLSWYWWQSNRFYFRAVSIEKCYVSNSKKTNLELKIDRFWTRNWILLKHISWKKKLHRSFEKEQWGPTQIKAGTVVKKNCCKRETKKFSLHETLTPPLCLCLHSVCWKIIWWS
jgi:hypothetical protein